MHMRKRDLESFILSSVIDIVISRDKERVNYLNGFYEISTIKMKSQP